ncbi:translation initiation factor eIF-2B subunit delta-like [Impatiens glandulifera]|uniref:translation initiation factor eIF-2B subunit delta-like n=1 Tax=Impatiens glandulifera TaxID=253017 RepID=UPI001FB0CA5C|nr:translation initiation factor eIF-2B subunit delta-like [Impatiens glandulifera]
MDSRRIQRSVIDPKVRHVGFFAPGDAPTRLQSNPPEPFNFSLPVSDISPYNPVMIPPPRHLSVGPLSPHRRHPGSNTVPVGSYNPSEFTSPTASNREFTNLINRTGSGKFASSLPSGGFGYPGIKMNTPPVSSLMTVSVVNQLPPDFSDKKDSKTTIVEKDGGTSTDILLNDQPVSSKPLKDKTSKAERRALQEAQRAAKTAAKAGVGTLENAKPQKPTKTPSQRKESSSATAPERKGGERTADKDRKKDAPHPRMQFDDKSRVEKAKKRAVVKQTEARNIVELFRHLPQYQHGTQLPHLQSKLFQHDPVHPAVYKVGLRYLSGDISGGNARCISMLQAFQDAIRDYTTPPEKSLIRDLTAKINSYVSFLIECRPLSITMGNAIRFLKTLIAKLPITLTESESKTSLLSDIDRFISEKIILADKVIVRHAVTKIREGDVLLTYGSSSAVEMLFVYAHELGKQFRVVIVDARPKLEGRLLLRRLLEKGLNCTYTNINAVSYIMHEVTRVFLGASSVLSNGTVYSRVGTACVAMVAHESRVPVIVCCEAYKFHERVQLDSICSNELGDPDVIAKIHGREDINYLDNWAASENLQLLNLTYDATPADYVSMIITDYGMVPPTSVPVIVGEYGSEHLWI